MRLHTLSFSAFGSFGGSETIDFDQLADAGLFLLHGPTGAGKTTVLDAVSFALFGTVPGVRPAGHGLRSDHAESSTPTEVRLEVTLDGRRFRIVRRPRQLRPKRRGDGLIEDAPTATVQELVGGSWVARAAKPAEADPYLQEHLHMGVTQFHQIVMLPQGDFARFLRANADDRRLVLEELFATHRFTEVERWLRARADTDRAAVSAADDGVRDLLVAAATVADVDTYPKDAPLTEAAAWLAEQRSAVADRLGAATAAERVARASHGEARAASEAAGQLAERQHRLAAARVARAELDERADAHAGDGLRRDAARRAAPVLPLLEQLAQAGARLTESSAAVTSARAVLADAGSELAVADRDGLADHDEAVVRELGQITELVADETQLEARQTEILELTDQLQALDDQLEALEAEQGAIPAQRQTVSDGLDTARAGAARRDDLGAALQHVERRGQAAAERDRLAVEVDDATRARDEATRAELDAQQAWLERFQAQLSGQAAVLAAALEDGQPCPVCGSPEHPEPATAGGAQVGEDEVAAAKQRFDAAAAQAKASDRSLRKLEKLLAAAQATGGDDTVEELAAAEAALRQQHGEAEAAAVSVPALEAQAGELEYRARTIDEEMRAAHRARRALDKARSRLEGGLSADRHRVERARAGFARLADRSAHLQARRQQIAAMIGALDDRAQADEAVLTALERAEAEAARHGFGDVTEAGAAALDPTHLDELSAAIDAHERRLAETGAELRQPDLLAAAALPPVELEEVQAWAARADRDLELASITADAVRKAADRLERIHADVERQLTELAPKLETYERSRRLADLATGDDRQVAHRMRLSTYVLAARLEQVACAASERLQRMSNGRYTLVHTDEAPDGRRKGGLGLRIVDAWTSTERETSTLSGGESFFTSLALALGVADVVSAENGGVAMETMFIDEGFGSLDDDTLQDVMDVLDSLRAGGRAIGIVSHVGDLRTRIANQLEVVKTSAGSRLRTTAPASAPAEAANPSTAA